MTPLPVPVMHRRTFREENNTESLIYIIDINQLIPAERDWTQSMLESGHPKMVQYAPPVKPEDPGTAELQLAGNGSLTCHES
jgi:hypothetical protein